MIRALLTLKLSFHRATFRQYLYHRLFLICKKISNLSHKPLPHGGYNRSTKISTKRCCFVFVRTFRATKTNIVWMMSHSFDSFHFYTRKFLYPRYFSPIACTLIKVNDHMTSDSDGSEVDLDMQLSFKTLRPVKDVQIKWQATVHVGLWRHLLHKVCCTRILHNNHKQRCSWYTRTFFFLLLLNELLLPSAN